MASIAGASRSSGGGRSDSGGAAGSKSAGKGSRAKISAQGRARVAKIVAGRKASKFIGPKITPTQRKAIAKRQFIKARNAHRRQHIKDIF